MEIITIWIQALEVYQLNKLLTLLLCDWSWVCLPNGNKAGGEITPLPAGRFAPGILPRMKNVFKPE